MLIITVGRIQKCVPIFEFVGVDNQALNTHYGAVEEAVLRVEKIVWIVVLVVIF